MASFNQVDEDFCDDINVITENEDDFEVAVVIFREFDSVSGAILSRSKKTLVMGLGEWKDQQIWPLPWIKVEDQLKILGFFVTPSSERTIVVNWERLVKKVSDVLISWRSRQLPSLRMRSESLPHQRFGTSPKCFQFCQGL